MSWSSHFVAYFSQNKFSVALPISLFPNTRYQVSNLLWLLLLLLLRSVVFSIWLKHPNNENYKSLDSVDSMQHHIYDIHYPVPVL